MRLNFLVFVVFITCQTALAAELDGPLSQTANQATEYVDPLAKYLLTAQFLTGTPSFSLELDNSDKSRKIQFAPNLAATVGGSLNFKDYVGVGFSIHGGPETDVQSKGETNYDDFRFEFDFKNFLVEAQYQRYNGLYVSNTSEVDFNAKSNLIEKDMSMQNIILAFTYVFRPRTFSIQGALSRTERQIKSGGSWLAGLVLNQITIANGLGLIPSSIRSSYGADQNITQSRNRSLIFSGGYAYTYAFTEKVFATAMALLGAGPGDSSFIDPTGTNNHNYFASHFNAKVISGYNGDRFIAGLFIEGQTISSETNSTSLQSNPSYIQFFFGTRY